MRFICVADEVGRLQRGDDPECKLFQKIAEQGHYAGRERPSSTRQGIYVTTASGRLLASTNRRGTRSMKKMLRKALAAWDALTPAEQHAAPEGSSANIQRMEARAPEGGLILRVFARDVDRPWHARDWHARDWRSVAWNMDQAWFTAAEARLFLPSSPVPGARHKLPARLAQRISRCHLIDNVRGQTHGFGLSDVERSEIHTEVQAIDGDRISLILRGQSRTEESGSWSVGGSQEESNQKRGVAVELIGRALFDSGTGCFVEFELVAVGTRWGGTRYNARLQDLPAAPIGFLFSLYRGESRVAPACFWSYGW